MGYKPWHLAAMEEHGHTTTNTGLINRVAYYLAKVQMTRLIPQNFVELAMLAM